MVNFLDSKMIRDSQKFSLVWLVIFAGIFATLGIYLLVRSFALNPNLAGDLNGDNSVNISDLSILLTYYGTSSATADINTDSQVNVTDLSILLSHFGQTYTPSQTKPSIPTGLSAVAGDGSVQLSWNANPAADQVDAYQVYVNSGNYNLNVTSTSLTVSGLTNGTPYAFRVSGHNAAGYGDWTQAVNATPSGPNGSGSIIFDADFDNNLDGDVSPFDDLEYGGTFDGTPAPNQRIQYDSSITRNGIGKSLKLTVAPGDVFGGSSGERTLIRGNTDPTTSKPPNIVEGDDDWYGTSLYIDPGWNDPSGWSWWYEIHQNAAQYLQASLKFGLYPGTNKTLVQLNAGQTAAPGGPWEVNRAITSGRTISIGVWYDIKWHLVASAFGDGRLQMWIRAKGEAWPATPNIDYSGPTLETGQGPTVNYAEFGLYRGASPGNTSVLHFNHFRIATDEAHIDQIFSL
jgi:hypothetical protein